MRSPTGTPTALLLIDLQLGLTHPSHPGGPRSTPSLESNITTLLSAARTHNTQHPTQPIHIIHVHHHSRHATSLLHPSHTIDWSSEFNGQRGIDPLPCAVPLDGEPVLVKSVNSAFIGTDLEARLRGLGVRQLLVVGTTTEHCVSTSVRMAANLNVVGDPDGFGERGMVLIADGCGSYGRVDAQGKVVVGAETVHGTEVEVLRGEFAECVLTEEAVRVIEGRK